MRILLAITLVIGTFFIQTIPAQATERTINRPVKSYDAADRAYAAHNRWTSFKKALYDKKNKHPLQWTGKEWDPKLWPENLTTEMVLSKLYDGQVLRRQYMKKGNPVVDVGPAFYALSDFDQERSLKLLSDYFRIFDYGYFSIQIKDGKTKKTIGRYTPRGIRLN